MSLATVADMDYSIVRHGVKSASGGVRNITNGMRSLGLIHEDTERALMMASGALQLVLGGVPIAKSLQSAVKLKTAQETAMAAAETAVNAAIPGVGWGKIALAGAVATMASVGVYAVVSRIRADLSTPIGRQIAADGVKGAMA